MHLSLEEVVDFVCFNEQGYSISQVAREFGISHLTVCEFYNDGMPDKSMAHTKWDCTYHIVFILKYRRKVLYREVRKKLMPIIKRLCQHKGIGIVEGGDVRRPCAHQPEEPPEAISSGGDGLPEREERAAVVRREPGFETVDWS